MAEAQVNYEDDFTVEDETLLSRLEEKNRAGTTSKDAYDALSFLPVTGEAIAAYELPGILSLSGKMMQSKDFLEAAAGTGLATLGVASVLPGIGPVARYAKKGIEGFIPYLGPKTATAGGPDIDTSITKIIASEEATGGSEKIAKHIELSSSKKKKQDIFKENKTFVDPLDNKISFEIDTKNANLLESAVKETDRGFFGSHFLKRNPNSEYGLYKLDELLTGMEDLFKQYPDLKDAYVQPFNGVVEHNGKLVQAGGAVDFQDFVIKLGPGTSQKNLTEKLLHETQHLVDFLEGRQPGGSPLMFSGTAKQNMKNYKKLSGEVRARLVQDRFFYNLQDEFPKPDTSPKKVLNTEDDIMEVGGQSFEGAKEITKDLNLGSGSLFSPKVKKGRKLLIVSCSADKCPDPGDMEAFDRYTGDMYKSMKKIGIPEENVDLAIMSAKYGLIRKDTKIPNYNVKMNKKIAKNLLNDSDQVNRIKNTIDGYDEVVVEGSNLYKGVIKEAAGDVPLTDFKIDYEKTLLDGERSNYGSGRQKQSVGNFLRSQRTNPDIMKEDGGVVEYEPTATDLMDKALFSPEMVYSDAKKEWDKGNYSESIAKYGAGLYADTPILRQAMSATNNAMKRTIKEYGKEPSFDSLIGFFKNLMVNEEGQLHMLSKADGGVVSLKDKAVNMNRGPQGIEPYVQYMETGGVVDRVLNYFGFGDETPLETRNIFEEQRKVAEKEKFTPAVEEGIARAKEGRETDERLARYNEDGPLMRMIAARVRKRGEQPFTPFEKNLGLQDDPYAKKPPLPSTYQTGVEFGDTEVGFDLLGQLDFNKVLLAGLRDSRTLSDYVKTPKMADDDSYKALQMSQAYYQGKDNIIQMSPLFLEDNFNSTLTHELMHKGADLLQKASGQDLQNLRKNVMAKGRMAQAEHRYIQSIVNKAYVDRLLLNESDFSRAQLADYEERAKKFPKDEWYKEQVEEYKKNLQEDRNETLLSEAKRVFEFYMTKENRQKFISSVTPLLEANKISPYFLTKDYDYNTISNIFETMPFRDSMAIFNTANTIMAEDHITQKFAETMQKAKSSRLTKDYDSYFPEQIPPNFDLYTPKAKAEGGVIGLKDRAVKMHRNVV